MHLWEEFQLVINIIQWVHARDYLNGQGSLAP
jgi:hypothetical protein